MSRPDLLSELARRPLLCDGAMGTQLTDRGAWTATQPLPASSWTTSSVPRARRPVFGKRSLGPA